MTTQDNWRWCHNCQGLWFAGNPHQGFCPALMGTVSRPRYEPHRFVNSGNYSLALEGPGIAGQPGWRWCSQCSGIFFIGNGSHGRCPIQRSEPLAHNPAGSGNYVLLEGGPGQSGWRWCAQCQGLFFNGGGSLGVCPVGGGPHTVAGSGNYSLPVAAGPRVAAAKYVITWQTLQGQNLQDDCDRVAVTIGPAASRPGVTEFFLRTEAAVTFSKELKILSPGRPDRIISTQDDRHGPVGPLEVLAGELNDAVLVLAKGKVLNIVSDMYHMNGLGDVSGQTVTFNWIADRCP